MYVVAPPAAARAQPGDTSGSVDAGGEALTAPLPAAHSPSLLPRTSSLPPLRVVGQVGAIYIIAEGPDGMFLIDQHAAHERIMYEKFLARRYGMVEGDVARQQLLEPLTLHVGSRLAGLVAAHLEELQQVGFAVEPFGGDTFLVRAVPGVLAGEDPVRVLEEIAASLGDRRNLVGEELEDQLVKMVCKRAAIKAGQQLSDIEMQELVRQLEQCQSPRTCPHGRPTMIQLSASELEKAFGRT
jgi:DNA mismatch repair protein MutL